MKGRIVFGFLLAVVGVGGFLTSRASLVAEQQPTGLYKPMAPFEDDPSSGGYEVAIGNKIADEYGRRVFLADHNNTIEVAVQYQVKVPVGYGPGGDVCRLVVQTLKISGCCDNQGEFHYELPLEPFAIRAGEHINDVEVVKIPAPANQEGLAVRVVLERMGEDGEWASRAVSTAYMNSL